MAKPKRPDGTRQQILVREKLEASVRSCRELNEALGKRTRKMVPREDLEMAADAISDLNMALVALADILGLRGVS